MLAYAEDSNSSKATLSSFANIFFGKGDMFLPASDCFPLVRDCVHYIFNRLKYASSSDCVILEELRIECYSLRIIYFGSVSITKHIVKLRSFIVKSFRQGILTEHDRAPKLVVTIRGLGWIGFRPF